MTGLSRLERRAAVDALRHGSSSASGEGPLEGFAEDNGLTIEGAQAIWNSAWQKLLRAVR